MAPTPYTPTGRLQLGITVDGLLHHVNIPVNIVLAGTDWFVINNQPAASNLQGGAVGQILWDKVKAAYSNTVAAPTWALYQRDDNIFIPRDGGSLTGAGASSNPYGPAMVITFTFKDASQHLARLQLPETYYANNRRDAYAALDVVLKPIADTYVVSTIGDDMRDFARTLADEAYDRCLFATSAPNRVIRRARGLA